MFDRVQEEEAAHFLLDVLRAPDDLFQHIRSEAGAVILRITYGYTPEAHGSDPLVNLVGKAMQNFADATVPGKYAVDVFPFRKFATEANLNNVRLTKESAVPPGLVPRHKLQRQSSRNERAIDSHSRATLQLRQAAG